MADEKILGRTNTRDPNAPTMTIIEQNGQEDKKAPKTIVGSTHLTGQIDGKWYVLNTRGEKLLQKSFVTEADAVEEAQKHNSEESKRGLTNG